jgi:hypothetical protein
VVLSLQTHDSLVRFGAKAFLPAVIVFSIIKESGPIIAGLIVSGRVGAGIGAELGSMKVTEQIDAMEASAVDSYKFLVATRVAACILMLPLLTVVSNSYRRCRMQGSALKNFRPRTAPSVGRKSILRSFVERLRARFRFSCRAPRVPGCSGCFPKRRRQILTGPGQSRFNRVPAHAGNQY